MQCNKKGKWRKQPPEPPIGGVNEAFGLTKANQTVLLQKQDKVVSFGNINTHSNVDVDENENLSDH